MMCCDGILERMESMEAIRVAWRAMEQRKNLHEKVAYAADAVLKEAMLRKSTDNVTVVIICLSSL